MGAVHSSCVYRTFRADVRGKVHRHHVAGTVWATVVGRRSQSPPACSIDVLQKAIRIHNSIQTCTDFYLSIVVDVQRMNLNDVFNLISRKDVSLREFLRWRIHLNKTGGWKRREFTRREVKLKKKQRELIKRKREPPDDELELWIRSGEGPGPRVYVEEGDQSSLSAVYHTSRYKTLYIKWASRSITIILCLLVNSI